MGGIDQVEFGPDAVVFRGYPIPGASVYPKGAVAWASVVEVGLDTAAPPELRLANERLFVSATLKDDLRREAEAHGVPVVERYDVWSLLLEPFLDTSFDDDDERRTGDLLERNGVTRDEARRIRETVGETMLGYNSMLWEWVHLGMFDLFLAHRPGPTSGRGIDEARFRELYARAQELAGRAGIDEYVAARRAAEAGGEAGGDGR
jgi:hypothetical protein